jgi:predicted nuclease of restriction endonuclease-like (RecB) superfamily
MRALESHTGASWLVRKLVSRRRSAERQQHRQNRDECDSKRRSARGIILSFLHILAWIE